VQTWLTRLTQVLRYSALGLGVFYGFYHQRSITTTQRKAAAQREYARKEKLIEQARAEYNKSKQPLGAPSSTSGGRKWNLFHVGLFRIHWSLLRHLQTGHTDGVCPRKGDTSVFGKNNMLTPNAVKLDPTSANFDLEAYITAST